MSSHDRPLVVIAALDIEAGALGRNKPDGLEVVISGTGKVAAAIAAQRACHRVEPEALISIGLAGGVNSAAQPGEVIVASGAVQHDYDARPFAPARGMIPGLGMSTFPPDPQLCARLVAAARGVVEDQSLVRTGLVLTGDQIITSRSVRDGILRDFPDGACFEMETAAVAQVARANGVPWGGVRIISDTADESFDLDVVAGFGVGRASELLGQIVGAFLAEGEG